MRIALLGDVSLTGMFDSSQSEDVFQRVKMIKQLVDDCDYVICNLESPLTERTNTMVCKGAYLRSDPCNIEVLKSMGITHVTLANNHVFDYGKRGAKDTISVLDKHGIQYCGLCNNPILLSKENDRALLDGFCCYSANGVYYGEKPLSIQLLSFDTLYRFFEKANLENCLPIASVHFGVERLHYPAAEHIELFHSLSDKYSFVLHGNHTHSIQGYEKNNDSLLIYSQGNLLFDDVLTTSIGSRVKQNNETRKTYVMKLDVFGNSIKYYESIAIQFDDDGYPSIDKRVDEELHSYCQSFVYNKEQIIKLRNEELKIDRQNSDPRNIKFYYHRLNLKYIGAFINGRIHSSKYKKLFSKYME